MLPDPFARATRTACCADRQSIGVPTNVVDYPAVLGRGGSSQEVAECVGACRDQEHTPVHVGRELLVPMLAPVQFILEEALSEERDEELVELPKERVPIELAITRRVVVGVRWTALRQAHAEAYSAQQVWRDPRLSLESLQACIGLWRERHPSAQ